MKRNLLFIGIFLFCALGGVFYLQQTSKPLTTTSSPLPSRVPSAFYQGGFERGSGGKVSVDSYGYQTAGLFEPSPAVNLPNALLPLEAYPSSQTCARCHVGIHDNWAQSMHAVSATDAWYLKVKDLLAFEQGEIAVRLCAGCHAPVALMTGEVGLYSRESLSSQQGVSCSFCHTLEGVHGGNGAWSSNPGRVRQYRGGDYLAEDEIENAAHLVMASPAVHKEDMMRPIYHDSAMCMSCHEFEFNGVALQSTYSEWRASRYAAEGTTCQDCHFTPGAGVSKPDAGHVVEHYPQRAHVYRHTLTGGSTVQAPRAQHNQQNLREALELEVFWNEATQLLQLNVHNRKAGHHIPTGVSDLRQLWLEIIAYDANGIEIFSSGKLDAAGYLPADTFLYHQVLGDANGNALERHDIWLASQILSDMRIPADGTQRHSLALPQESQHVRVRLLWRDAPASFVRGVLKQTVTDFPVVVLAEWQQGSLH